MKSLFFFLLTFTSLSQAATYVPMHQDDKNIIICSIYDGGYITMNYYLINGMLTYTTYNTYDPATNKLAEEVILQNSTMSALDPFGSNRRFSVVDVNGNEYLKLTASYKTLDTYSHTFLTYYNVTFNNASGSCTLEEDAPANASSADQF